MTTEHTVVRSGKSKRKPFNSNVADYLLIIATFGPRGDSRFPESDLPGFYVRMGARQTGTVAAPAEGAPNRLLPVFEIDVSPLRLERPG
jgi:hypothetical protein